MPTFSPSQCLGHRGMLGMLRAHRLACKKRKCRNDSGRGGRPREQPVGRGLEYARVNVGMSSIIPFFNGCLRNLQGRH
eukprot:1160758-Pelagomonas_calceolata.AAC.7